MKQSALPARGDGLLRGACHRARIRATRWLAMTTGLPSRGRRTYSDVVGLDWG
jgi:hypothetical protein